MLAGDGRNRIGVSDRHASSRHKEVLGLWIEQTGRRGFWLRGINELRARGNQDIRSGIEAEGLKGILEVTAGVLLDTNVYTGMVHPMR